MPADFPGRNKSRGYAGARINAQNCQLGDNPFAGLLRTKAAVLPPLLQGKADLVSNTANLDSNTALFLLPCLWRDKGRSC